MPDPNCEQCFGRGEMWRTEWIRGAKGERDQPIHISTVCQPCREYDAEMARTRTGRGQNGNVKAKL